MCLSEVYLINKKQEKELLCKNVASMTTRDSKLIFTNLLGATTEVEGQIERVDLMENYIYVRTEA